MNKKLILIFVVVLILALFVATAVALAKKSPVPFEIINRSDQPVSMSLTTENVFYYLTVPPETTKIFTVEREVYERTTWSCGLSETGTLDVKTFLHLTFTRCYGKAPNWGEPGWEKVHIPDAPQGVLDRYQ